MTTVHLPDAQFSQFTATGLIVVDPDVAGDTTKCHVVPELWRKLTDPCPTCGGHGKDRWGTVDRKGNHHPFGPCPNPDCAGGCQVVTVTATCPCQCHVENMPARDCGCGGSGVVTLGRFTIRLLPVTRSHDQTPPPFLQCEPDEEWQWLNLGDGFVHPLTLDPPPQPDQWIVQFEAVE